MGTANAMFRQGLSSVSGFHLSKSTTSSAVSLPTAEESKAAEVKEGKSKKEDVKQEDEKSVTKKEEEKREAPVRKPDALQALQELAARGGHQHQQEAKEETKKETKEETKEKPGGNTIHSVTTSNGSPYQNFQNRIMYGTYKLVQAMPGGEKMTGFTRILHRMKGDELMEEIPTFRATPLHPKCDDWCDFPVADRPNAVRQWVDAVDKDSSMVKGAWVLVLECDYVWMKPLQAPDAYDSTAKGQAFHFDYIQPAHPDCAHIIKRLYKGGNPQDVPASGPAPVLIRMTDLKKVTPDWENVTAQIEADDEAKKTLDWIREMYAWDVALALNKVDLDTQLWPKSKLIAQPPHDLSIGEACMFHYTWGSVYKLDGKEIWHWDKRDYTSAEVALKVPKLPLPPDWKDGLKLQDGLPISEVLHDTIKSMLVQMNKAIETLPDLSKK